MLGIGVRQRHLLREALAADLDCAEGQVVRRRRADRPLDQLVDGACVGPGDV